VFCQGQYIDLATASSDCMTYLESQGISTGGTSARKHSGGCNTADGSLVAMILAFGAGAAARRRRASSVEMRLR
jgi:uncharacterized protein (TIGR03382 family)